MWALIEFPVGLVYANGLEWLIHKHLLHGVGRNKKSIWAFHWHEHHKSTRTNAFVDDAYNASMLSWDTKTKEIVSLLAIALAHVPVFFVAPWFTVAAWLSAANYFRVHRKAHLNPEWARKHLPWHFDHHMGPNQDANWCATFPLFDWLLGTREHYVGTERARDDFAREAARRSQPSPATTSGSLHRVAPVVVEAGHADFVVLDASIMAAQNSDQPNGA